MARHYQAVSALLVSRFTINALGTNFLLCCRYTVCETVFSRSFVRTPLAALSAVLLRSECLNEVAPIVLPSKCSQRQQMHNIAFKNPLADSQGSTD